MSNFEQVLSLVDQIEMEERVKLFAHLRELLRAELSVGDFKELPWALFLDLTYGILAHDPIELVRDTLDTPQRLG